MCKNNIAFHSFTSYSLNACYVSVQAVEVGDWGEKIPKKKRKQNKTKKSFNTRRKEIPHVLTYRWVLNNENTWTQGGEHYTLGSVGGNRVGKAVGGQLGRDSMGRNARYRWRGGRQQITLQRVYLCNNLACSSHVPQNLKCNKKRSNETLLIKSVMRMKQNWRKIKCWNG